VKAICYIQYQIKHLSEQMEIIELLNNNNIQVDRRLLFCFCYIFTLVLSESIMKHILHMFISR
jgi:hypothetical protein